MTIIYIYLVNSNWCQVVNLFHLQTVTNCGFWAALRLKNYKVLKNWSCGSNNRYTKCNVICTFRCNIGPEALQNVIYSEVDAELFEWPSLELWYRGHSTFLTTLVHSKPVWYDIKLFLHRRPDYKFQPSRFYACLYIHPMNFLNCLCVLNSIPQLKTEEI